MASSQSSAAFRKGLTTSNGGSKKNQVSCIDCAKSQPNKIVFDKVSSSYCSLQVLARSSMGLELTKPFRSNLS